MNKKTKSRGWVNFKQLKSEVSIEKVLEHYGLLSGLKRKGDNLVGPCPIHQGKNPTQFHVSLAKNNFNCFGDCHGGGNILDFVARMEKVDIREAGLMIQEWFGIEPEAKEKEESERDAVKEEPAKEGKEAGNPPLTFTLKNIEPEHPYLRERGLDRETVDYFGLGCCKKGLMAGRIVVPIHNQKGELVAYIGRWPGQPPEGEPKYKMPAGFHKSLEVFNLHRASDKARDQGLIVVEGFFDCFRLFQAGFKNVVAVMGSSLSQEQRGLIVEAVGAPGKVVLMLDGDEAGRKGTKEALELLSGSVFVKVVKLKNGKQPDGLSDEELREILGEV